MREDGCATEQLGNESAINCWLDVQLDVNGVRTPVNKAQVPSGASDVLAS